MYTVLTGPMLWLSFAICILGCAWRVYKYVKGLNWQLDRVAYGKYPDLALKGALKSIFHWLIPFASCSWQAKPVFATAFFLLHIGLVIVPLFLYAHIMIVAERFGVSWPNMPNGLADILTILSILAGVFILLRRFALSEVRIITTRHDIMIMAISLAPLVTGFVAAHQSGDGNSWLLAHIITGEIWLIAVPFTKLSHAVLFFCSRAQIGIDFGVKRGGQRGSGIVW